MIISWRRLYHRQINFIEYIGLLIGHFEYILKILQLKPRTLLEVGCGTASHALFLSYFVPLVVAIDNDLNILRNARSNVKSFKGNVEFVMADAFAMPFKAEYFDICISQGLLEHFRDEQVGMLVMEQLRVGRKIVASMPSNYYPFQDVEYERHMGPIKWSRVLRSSIGLGVCVKAQYYRLDLRPLLRIAQSLFISRMNPPRRTDCRFNLTRPWDMLVEIVPH